MTPKAADPAQRFVRLASAIRAEMQRTDAVVAEAREAITDFAEARPSRRELRGIGDIAHDFYTGLERIFEKIAPELNGGLPAAAAWHRELLDNMTLELPSVRPAVLTRQTAHLLDEYLRFRHLFRNLYGYELEWERIQPMVQRMPETWDRTRAELDESLSFLDRAGAG